MADPNPDGPVVSRGTSAAEGGHSPLLRRLALLMVLASIVIVECIAASFFLPSREETAAMAGLGPQTAPVSSTGLIDELAALDADVKDQVEVDLGDFSVTAFQPLSNTTMRIDFHLYGTVAQADHLAFTSAWQENQHRLRDQVIVTVRSAELPDLTDAGLGLIKRRILEKTNRILGRPMLRTVIFSEFSFIEQ